MTDLREKLAKALSKHDDRYIEGSGPHLKTIDELNASRADAALATFRAHLESEETRERVWAAFERATCPHREGPYGLYNYGADDWRDANGKAVKKPHVVRDFRDPNEDTYGAFVYETESKGEAEAEYERLTKSYIASTALASVMGDG